MPGKSRPKPLQEIPPDQLDTARALFLRRRATPQWVAAQLNPPVHWRAVERVSIALGWVDERTDREAARVRRSKRSAEDQAALEVEQDEHHAAAARRTMDLRDALITKAESAVGEMTPVQALRAIKCLDGLKDLQFVERLARNRETEKAGTGVGDWYTSALRTVLGDGPNDDRLPGPSEPSGSEGAPRGD